MDTIGEVMRRKMGGEIVSVRPDMTVLAATQVMNEWSIGCVLVTRGARLLGIFTERDVLRRVVGESRDPRDTPVRDVMTIDVVCCTPENTVDEVAELMRRRRVRHLPVIDANEQVVGLVSIGDVNAFRYCACEVALHQVEDYLHRRS